MFKNIEDFDKLLAQSELPNPMLRQETIWPNEYCYEWWRGDRKLTIYVDCNDDIAGYDTLQTCECGTHDWAGLVLGIEDLNKLANWLVFG